MIEILNVLKAIYERESKISSEAFQKGFSLAISLVKIGIKKSPLYNKELLIDKLKKELNDALNDVSILSKKNQQLGKQINDNLAKDKEQEKKSKIIELENIIKQRNDQITKLKQEQSSLKIELHNAQNEIKTFKSLDIVNQVVQLKERNKNLCKKVHDELYKNQQFAKIDSQLKNVQRFIETVKALIKTKPDIKQEFEELRKEYLQEDERIQNAYK